MAVGCVAPIVDCICKDAGGGFTDNQIAGLFRYAADELDKATMTNDGKLIPPLKANLDTSKSQQSTSSAEQM
jgi:hypothetical protein